MRVKVMPWFGYLRVFGYAAAMISAHHAAAVRNSLVAAKTVGLPNLCAGIYLSTKYFMR